MPGWQKNLKYRYKMSGQNPLPRVKICGITSINDSRYALAAGADAIGLVFYPQSPRYVTAEQANTIANAAGPFITVVGLFVNAQPKQVKNIMARVPLNLLQFHGDESPEYCQQFSLPYLKAIRMKSDMDLMGAMNAYTSASGILLDTYRKGVPGGTGECFSWNLVPHNWIRPIVVAGGLTPENVRQAMTIANPYGVDVSGGVESVPGIKDEEKIYTFMSNVKRGVVR